MKELWPALWLSFRIATCATVLGVLLGVPLAQFMARRRFVGKSLLESIIVLPMVLPPTVIGYILLELLGRAGPLYHLIGYSITFRFEGAILAAMIVALPLLYLPAKAGFAAVEREQEDTARLMGANRFQVFWHVSLPLASRGLYSGVLLAFARALGEFGATLMVFGWTNDRVTLPIAIYADWSDGDMSHAAPEVIALSVITLILAIAYNRSTSER